MTKIPHIIEQLHIQKNKIYNGKITTYKEESSTYKEMSTTYDDKHTIFNGHTTEYTEKYFAYDGNNPRVVYIQHITKEHMTRQFWSYINNDIISLHLIKINYDNKFTEHKKVHDIHRLGTGTKLRRH
jgi:hypothetical protein